MCSRFIQRSLRHGALSLALVVSGTWTHGAAAQEAHVEPAAGDLQQALHTSQQMIGELLKRLDAQDAVNKALLQRVTALEEMRPAGRASAPIAEAEPARRTSEQALDVQPTQELLEVTERVQERLDALPRLVGYYDFEFFKEDRPQTFGEFRQHHLSLHLSKEIDRYRVFSEIEFEYGTVLSADNAGRLTEARGKLFVEQTWAEYVASDLLTLRGGWILTPNYWNVNHYPNIVLSTRSPLMVRRVYPQSLTGIMAYGTRQWSRSTFAMGYTAYVANGDSSTSPQGETNEAKAVGGALSVRLPTGTLVDGLTVAVNGYRDTPAAASRRTHIWGVESQARRGPFELLVEYANRRGQDDRRGIYVQPSYRFGDSLAAFYRFDRLTTTARTNASTWGVSFRPITPVSLKAEYFRTSPERQRTSNGVASSLAVAF